ncbi:hypothetical protein [Serratia plymuthica]|uniref:glycine-rich domain-containing protein n=1 Tax=Serratia plymuthica TaxID=82996 RepID=UPI00141A3E1E|nr:hypothetical protein [Serratia plymuthica]NIC28294.1 hypothetical protein [Serratia plymuthica]
MAKNEFLPFGTAANANVLSNAAYQALPARVAGFGSGVAKSEELNSAWRQGSTMAAVLGQFIADKTGQDVLDDGDLNGLLDKFKGAMGGCLIGIQRFTASGTYTPTPGMRYAIADVVGGGGGGGGCSATNSDNAAVSGGGASGSFIRGKFDIASVGASVAINIGSGGAGGVGGDSGAAGGDTKFGALATATGGRGGTSSTSPASSAFIAVGGAPGATPTGGNLISSRGSRGGAGLFFNSSTGAVGGDGAPSQFGGGGIGSGSSGTTGADGSGFGSGGGGNARQPASGAVNGYSGAPGVVIIYEYS